MRSNFVFQEIWVGLRRNLTMTVALIVVVAISLSLLGTGLLFVKQVDRTRTYWQSQVEISVYLCYKGDINPNCHGAVTTAQQQTLQQRLTVHAAGRERPVRLAATGVHAVQIGDVERAVARLDRHRETNCPPRSRSSCGTRRPTTKSWPARSKGRRASIR